MEPGGSDSANIAGIYTGFAHRPPNICRVFTINDARVRVRVVPVVVVAVIAAWLVGLQTAASVIGFEGPLHSLLSDYIATPKSATVPWVGLGLAVLGLPARNRIWTLAIAAGLDACFAGERMLRGGVLTIGNGPLIVLTGLTALVATRWHGVRRVDALRAISFGALIILATKMGDAWLHLTTIIRPTVWDQYAALADHALAQPSWLMGQVVDAGGPSLQFVLHWVYIELPVAAMAVAAYQLRNVVTAGWPQHFLIRTFLVLGLIGPVIYVLFPVVGPVFAFPDHWPSIAVPTELVPQPMPFNTETPRNCMPSMHTAWALAVFLHSRNGPRWLRIGGALWLACTIVATLGFGYHYGIDLVAGAVLCLSVEAALTRRPGLAAAGTAVLVSLLLCCRYLSDWMARYPEFFGPLMIGALVAMWAGFVSTSDTQRAEITLRLSK